MSKKRRSMRLFSRNIFYQLWPRQRMFISSRFWYIVTVWLCNTANQVIVNASNGSINHWMCTTRFVSADAGYILSLLQATRLDVSILETGRHWKDRSLIPNERKFKKLLSRQSLKLFAGDFIYKFIFRTKSMYKLNSDMNEKGRPA